MEEAMQLRVLAAMEAERIAASADTPDVEGAEQLLLEAVYGHADVDCPVLFYADHVQEVRLVASSGGKALATCR